MTLGWMGCCRRVSQELGEAMRQREANLSLEEMGSLNLSKPTSGASEKEVDARPPGVASPETTSRMMPAVTMEVPLWELQQNVLQSKTPGWSILCVLCSSDKVSRDRKTHAGPGRNCIHRILRLLVLAPGYQLDR